MKKTWQSFLHLFGFERLSSYEKDYFHDANVLGCMYIGYITVAMEVWMLARQSISKIIPNCLEGMGLLPALIKYTTKFWLLLLCGLAISLFCQFYRNHKTSKMKKGWFIALVISGSACVLYTFVLSLETFFQAGDSITPVMAQLCNVMLVCLYLCLFVIGMSVVIYALFRYLKSRRVILLEYLIVITFALICFVFGIFVSYTDFWEQKQITCFLMMSIYVGYLLIYRPFITVIVLSSAFGLFYSILLTFQNGLSFQPKKVDIQGVTYTLTSGDTANYLIFLFSLITVCIAIYHGRLREATESRRIYRLFDQTSEALATAIDAKDKYTHGHSTRVADYSVKIARAVGKSEEECQQIYYAALLHDVGKIGVPDSIINKDGKLTDEEFAQIKLHPVHGNNILSRISEAPYLSIGAQFHHERYDGRGYPSGRKGEDIPEIARIIAVADSYDAMTSKRSYRDPMPQTKVREEIYQGIGTQFDPEFAHQMIDFIDLDTSYLMQEGDQETNQGVTTKLNCEDLYEEFTEGIVLNDKIVRIRMYSKPADGYTEKDSLPSLVLFDSLDARIHLSEYNKRGLRYFEYARIRLDGEVFSDGTRSIEKSRTEGSDIALEPEASIKELGLRYDIQIVREKDHIQVHIENMYQAQDITLALPDSVRFSYVSITGSHCAITNIHIQRDEESIPAGYITRIAPEISYIDGAPTGDIPNVEIVGWRADTSEGILLKGRSVLSFHSQSLPMAFLIWHCPYIVIYTSDDGQVNGDNYREFGVIRLDGETWMSDDHAENIIDTKQTNAFKGWNDWKEKNREGVDITITLIRDGNTVILDTQNLGIILHSKTIIHDEVNDLYASITGDECAITDIHISVSDSDR